MRLIHASIIQTGYSLAGWRLFPGPQLIAALVEFDASTVFNRWKEPGVSPDGGALITKLFLGVIFKVEPYPGKFSGITD